MRPLIGVCASHDTEKKMFFVRTNYMDTIMKAGGLPLLLPMTREKAVLEEMAENLDGLLLAGGGDVNPVNYHAEKHPNCGEIDPLRDDFELALIDLVLERNLPIFGICRGIQVLTVALGGTLYQDIPSELPVDETHMQEPPYDEPIHEIEILPGGLLAEILKTDRMSVNSTHHQSVRETGPRLLIDAKSPAGIVEAVHMKNNPTVFGVQFHPEHFAYKSDLAQALFNYFIGCCKK